MRKIAARLKRRLPGASLYPRRWCARLKSESLSDFIARSSALPVDSADELAAGPIDRARAWTIPGLETAPDHSRVLRVDGYNLFAAAEADLERPSIDRAYLVCRLLLEKKKKSR